MSVLLNFEESPIKKLTWHHMILLKRVTSLTNKPLIVPVDIKISAKDIADLWMANASGIVVQIASQEDISKLADLNKLIGEINLPLGGKNSRHESPCPSKTIRKKRSQKNTVNS